MPQAIPGQVGQDEVKQRREWKLTLTATSLYRMVTALALAVCGLVLFVVHEQARTIEAQRVLIHDLFQDSLQLNAIKQKQQEQKRLQREKDAEPKDQTASPKAAADGCLYRRGLCT